MGQPLFNNPKKKYYLLTCEYTGAGIGIITYTGNLTNFNNRIANALKEHEDMEQLEVFDCDKLEITTEDTDFQVFFKSDNGEGFLSYNLVPIKIY